MDEIYVILVDDAPDGSLAETEITISPMYSGAGEVSAAVGVFATSF